MFEVTTTAQLWVVIGAGVAAAILFVVLLLKLQSRKRDNDYLNQQLVQLHETHAQTEALHKRAAQDLQDAQREVIELRQQVLQAADIAVQRDLLRNELDTERRQNAQQLAQYEARIATLNANEKAAAEKLQLLQDAEQKMQTQFENLANRIFEQKSASFVKANQTGLDGLLSPLKEQIEGFKKQVADAYIREGQERASLKTEILGLKELNQRITAEASALTSALKGDNKQQGNWGEVVLERILEQSGLREGHEFTTQASLRSEEGRQLQPDIVVHLPNEKDVVIDSKVSLIGYEGYHASDDEQKQAECLRQHVQSIRTHIKGLGKKDYQKLQGLRSLDYVLMFIPIEPAFLLAVEHDPDIVNFALSNNIMLVSPTNLLVALRTINNIWQYEYQNQNAQLIAERAAKLYDKFTGFVTDMEKLGKSLDTTAKTYDAALNKLSSGKGNLVRQVEQFKTMGVQPSKQLPKHLISDDSADE
ncbi:DNA recombination protein RmuC [Alteromonas sp. ASW11-36]|uniref:DNA recombination protein RmuC n=1 Tax=Alteromonas arenosi TaxID=3055817 RepID=A0ABT7SZL9_9ALTE|nr:DNA recombination protein RmuC [Alteromonas sp. ASW11-36]MDM7860984.1 DNA recombination protein RmuC [Alteromonas sp. ASW11-36]